MVQCTGYLRVTVKDDMDLTGSTPQRAGRIKRTAAGASLVALISRSAKRQLHDDHPDFVWGNHRSEVLRLLALNLATAGREDAHAVTELKDAAGHHRKDLLRAAAAIRSRGRTNELISESRANRLLLAAALDRPFESLNSQEQSWFDTIREFTSLPIESAFLNLVSLQPKLRAFAELIEEWPSRVESNAIDADQRQREIMHLIGDGLEHLVGPSADSSDPLVRSRAAYRVAHIYLERLAGHDAESP